MTWRPTAAEERALALRGRARRWMRAGWISDVERRTVEAERASAWKAFALLPRIGIFILAFNAASASRILLGFQPALWKIGLGLALIALAEALIQNGRFFRTGLEEGVWAAGLLLLLFDAFALGESSLLFEVWFPFACGIATLLLALRLLHTFFFLCGIAMLTFWAAEQWSPVAAGWILAAAGSVALAVHLRPAERPFQASASGWVALLAPVAAWALVREESLGVGTGIALGCAFLWIGLGVRHRSRFALAGGTLAALAFGYQVLEPGRWPVEWKLIAGGGALLAVAFALERHLRAPREGFTSQALDVDAEPALLEMAAVAAVAPATGSRDEGFAGEGGRYGGGGASGEY